MSDNNLGPHYSNTLYYTSYVRLELMKEPSLICTGTELTSFSDGTDMFTWYARYKEKITTLDEEIKNLITKENPNKKVNIYLIPNFKSKGGNFYTVCTNIGEKLDLSNISSFEEAKQLDETFTKRGGVILKKDEEINSVSFTKGNKR